MPRFFRTLPVITLFILGAATAEAQELWINEFHYDNDGADSGEFVEVVVNDGVASAPADIEVVLYNGANGAVYGSHALDTFTAGDSTAGFTFYSKAIAGIQNGAPDGLALINDGVVVQFLSYEGGFTAGDGPAAGLTSTDVGVSEPGSTPAGQSLQLAGTGTAYADFTWQSPAAETPGGLNNGQTLQAAAPVLNEIVINTTGSDPEFFELAGSDGADLSDYHLLTLDGNGEIRLAIALTGSVNAGGYWVAASPEAEIQYGITADQSFPDSTFTNDARTYLLVETFTGAVDDDLDTDDDGTLDIEPWSTVLDGLAVIDGSAPLVYADAVIGPDGSFLAAGALRCTDLSGDWEMHDFNTAPDDGTPGAANACGAFIAPSVTTTDPGDGATAVAVNTDLTITFDQTIDAQAGAVTLDCGGNPVGLTGLPASGVSELVLIPDSALPQAVSCTATITASGVGNANGQNLTEDYVWSFQTELGTLEIWQIQGSGAASPYADQTVTTEANIVTAIGPEGFFMQTPTARSDGDVNTSDGVYVFTDTAPTVSVGDTVDVTGEVVEFFDFTEFTTNPAVTITGTGNLPPPVTLDETVPSPDPDNPSCVIELECYEGMRVEIPAGVIGSGNQSFATEPFAEVAITAGNARAFREPGVIAPGPGGTIPVWDGNPEVFELSPTALGLPEMALHGGSTFSATGVISYSFGDYELWPTDLQILDEPDLPRAVPTPAADEVSVGSINLLRLFNATNDSGDDDYVEDPAVYAERLNRFATHIVESMQAPAVIAVQEIENIQTLDDLADEIALVAPGLNYDTELIEGNDVGGIDVGYLVRADVTILGVDQLGENEILSFDGSLLHDRPPLLLQVAFSDGSETLEMNLLAVHMRSLNGIDGTGNNAERVKTKRLEQAQSTAQMVQGLQTTQPDVPVVVLGDFNAFQFTDGYVDLLGQVAGTAAEDDSEFWAEPITDPVMQVSTLTMPPQERYSYVFRGNAQVLDHGLYSQAAVPHFLGAAYTRGNADAPEEYVDNPPAGNETLSASDHDSLVLTFSVTAELVFADGFEN